MTNFKNTCKLNRLIGNTPSVNPANWDAVKRQYSLIDEEFTELRDAIADKDITEIRDAIADVLVTTYGLAYLLGIDADTDFKEVHRSNMSKFCITYFEAEATAVNYEIMGVAADITSVDDDLYVVTSSFDQHDTNGKYFPKGKLLKSVNYSPPRLGA